MHTNSTKDIQYHKEAPNSDEIENYFPGFISFIDVTEQQIPRPVDKRRRDSYYSGKKKRHTVKTQLMINSQGFIVHKTGYKKGRRDMYDIYKQNYPIDPKKVVNVFDLGGYLGVEKDFPGQMLSILNRKKRNLKLTQEEKEYNKDHSKKRIVIEHTRSLA